MRRSTEMLPTAHGPLPTAFCPEVSHSATVSFRYRPAYPLSVVLTVCHPHEMLTQLCRRQFHG